jgi:hypothetical protein
MSIAVPTSSPGAISNYAQLLTEVQAWLDRTDLTARIPGFIRLCEARLNRVLNTPEMEKVTTLYQVMNDIPLPADFTGMRGLYLDNIPNGALRGMSPDSLISDYNGEAGIPTAYAIVGQTIRLAPPPNGPFNLKMIYFAKIPVLTDAAPNNWLLAANPDVYLWGTLLAASAFIDDAARVQQWKFAYDQAIAEVTDNGNQSRWGAGPIVPNTYRQVRGVRA